MRRTWRIRWSLALRLPASPLWPGALSLALASTPAACSSRSPDDFVKSGASVTLTRGPCYGKCPIYTVKLAADGAVEFSGHRFVGTCGTAQGRVAPDVWAQLMGQFHRARFFELEDAYDETSLPRQCATDHAHTTTSIRVGNEVKQIVHSAGCRDVPPELTALEDAIDAAAGSQKWIDGCEGTGSLDVRVELDPGSAALRPEHAAVLDAALKEYRSDPRNHGLIVTGFAAEEEDRWRELAMERAEAVKAHLVARGLESILIETRAWKLTSALRQVELRVNPNTCGCPGPGFGP